MVGDQIEICFDELGHPSALEPGQLSGSAFPEDAMVNENRIRLSLTRALE